MTSKPSPPGSAGSKRRSLADVAPHLLHQWHPEKNGALRPQDVAQGSDRRVWWRCEVALDHEWQAAVHSRVHGAGCPFCAGHRATLESSLATLAPEIAAQWHPTRNGTLRPEDVRTQSGRKVWWLCDVASDHVWETFIFNRCRGSGCPFCAGQRASVTNSLARLAPEVAAQWHPSKNGALTPSDVPRGSNRAVWWKCPLGKGHEWKAPVSRRSAGSGCPACAGRRVSEATSLAKLVPEIARDWHPTKNAPLTPADVSRGTGRSIWWQCHKNPEHEWRTSIASRTKDGHRCPFCTGRRVTRETSLAALRPELATQWHPEKNGALTPYDVTLGSSACVWWKCPRGPDHEWSAQVNKRTGPAPQGCPFCSSHRVSMDNCLATRFPDVAREWHPSLNAPLSPSTVMGGSNKKVWWRCQFGHVWKATVGSRTGPRHGGCVVCSKGRRRKVATTGKRRETVRLSKYEGATHGPVRSVK
jgi:hypothetical protein